MIGIFRFLFVTLAMAGTQCTMGPLGDDATELYLRTVRHLAVNRRAIDAETVADLARRDAAVSPVGASALRASEALPFQKLFDASLPGVDWPRAQGALATLAEEMSGGEVKRAEVEKKEAGVLAPRVRVADLIGTAGVERPFGNLILDSHSTRDDALYVTVEPRVARGTFNVVGYDGTQTTLAKIDGTQIRALLPTSNGGAIAVGMKGTELELVEIPSGERKIHSLPKRIANILTARPKDYFGPGVHLVEDGKGGKTIAVFWKDFSKYRADLIRLGGPKVSAPPHGSYEFVPSPDRQRLYAYGTTSQGSHLLVKDLVSGKELLREKSTGSERCAIEEVAPGEVRFAALDPQTGSLREYELPSGKTREFAFGKREAWGTNFVRRADGKSSLVVHGFNDLWIWHPGEPEPRKVAFPGSGARTFTTAAGRMYAANVKGGAMHVLDLETLTTIVKPLPSLGSGTLELRDIKVQPNGRAMAVVATQGAVFQDGAAIVQLFGPKD